ncbi:MAG: ATP-dependent protease ATPase subunit HslU, partial [Thermoanaerobaculia bacterium]
APEENERNQRTRDKMKARLEAGELEESLVELQVEQKMAPVQVFGSISGMEQMETDLQQMFERIMPKQAQQRKVPIKEARRILLEQETEGLIDRAMVAREARERVEQGGMIFLDEIDKIAGREGSRGPDVSREGVQRDLLPIVEGTNVSTKYGMVKTDHILFVAAGAFHVSKPSDLIPELQGRFPIRVELDALTEQDFVRILTEPETALTKQYSALLSTEKVDLEFTPDAVAEIARLAVEVNAATENIGARRLSTLMERLLDEVSYDAPDMAGVSVTVDGEYVRRVLSEIVQNQDLSRYVL